jgi:fluoride ion exporter CrcB/FEX
MSKGQMVLAVLLLLSIVSCFLPWLTAKVTVDGEDRSTTNQGYQYIIPLGARYTIPIAIINIVGILLSVYSFKATENVRKLNIIAGILMLVGAIGAFAYTFSAALGEAGGSSNISVDVSAEYGIGLQILSGFLMIIVGWRTERAPERNVGLKETKMLGFLRKSKKTSAETERIISPFEEFCGNDKETYEALQHTMFLDPKKIETSMKGAVENAKRFEKEKNPSRAKIWYDVAGGIAIYEGNVKKVMEFFGEAERISGTKYPILKNPEKVVATAQEYYKKYLKT